MKVKVNNLKLIVKKEKGGDIPKFKKPSGKINTVNYGIGATARDSSGRIYWEWAKPKSAGYSSAVDRAVAKARLANSKNNFFNVYKNAILTINGMLKVVKPIMSIRGTNSSKPASTKNSSKPTSTKNPRRGSTKTIIQTSKPVVETTTQETTTQPTIKSIATINAPAYQNLLSDMTMYKNNPDTFVERFGDLNSSYTGFASKTPGQLYATSINDMTDEARAQYLLGLSGLYDMYQKDPTEAINYAKYNFFVPLNNATVGDYALAQLNGTKPQNNVSPVFYDLVTNWYANNKPVIDNYFNNSTNYSQDFNLKVLNFLDKYKLYKPKFAKHGTKLISRKK